MLSSSHSNIHLATTERERHTQLIGVPAPSTERSSTAAAAGVGIAQSRALGAGGSPRPSFAPGRGAARGGRTLTPPTATSARPGAKPRRRAPGGRRQASAFASAAATSRSADARRSRASFARPRAPPRAAEAFSYALFFLALFSTPPFGLRFGLGARGVELPFLQRCEGRGDEAAAVLQPLLRAAPAASESSALRGALRLLALPSPLLLRLLLPQQAFRRQLAHLLIRFPFLLRSRFLQRCPWREGAGGVVGFVPRGFVWILLVDHGGFLRGRRRVDFQPRVAFFTPFEGIHRRLRGEVLQIAFFFFLSLVLEKIVASFIVFFFVVVELLLGPTFPVQARGAPPPPTPRRRPPRRPPRPRRRRPRRCPAADPLATRRSCTCAAATLRWTETRRTRPAGTREAVLQRRAPRGSVSGSSSHSSSSTSPPGPPGPSRPRASFRSVTVQRLPP